MSAWAATRHPIEGGRWRLTQGPIDLVIGAEGDAAVCDAAHEEAWQRLGPVLQTLVDELPVLRSPCPSEGPVDARVRGPVAQRMVRACDRLARETGLFITPMAAVAGSVADHLIECYRRPGVRRAYVNNGGDIALHLDPGERYRVGVVADLQAPAIDAVFDMDGSESVRGIASSGWRGRSLSMGIADTVTVIARDAAAADAAATLIGNLVNVNDSSIVRAPASSVRDDSDLGDRPVTVAVGVLSEAQINRALESGRDFAQHLLDRGLIDRAGIVLARRWRVVARVGALDHVPGE